jgi:O-antigen ligase
MENIPSTVKKIPAILAALVVIVGSLVISKVLTYEYINTKAFAIEIGLAIVVALTLWIFPVSIWKKVVSQPVTWGIALFSLTLLISTLASMDHTTSWFGNIDRGTGTLLLLILASAAVALGATLDRVQARKYILLPITISGALLALSIYAEEAGWGVLRTATHGGFLGNTSVTGTYFLCTIFITLYLLLRSSKLLIKIVYGAALAVMVLNTTFVNISFFTHPQGLFSLIGEAKGAAMSLLVGLGISASVWLATSSDNQKKNIGRILFIAILAVSALGIVELVQPQSAVHSWFVKQETDVRFVYWNIALKGFAAHPIVGTGPETYGYTYQTYFNPIVMLKSHSGELWSNKPHNMYLQVASETGIIGSIGYLALFAGLLWSIVRLYRSGRDRRFLVTVVGLLAAYLLNNVIFFDTVTSYLLLFMITAYVMAATPYEVVPAIEPVWQKVARGIKGIAIVVVVLLIVIPQITKTHRAYKEFLLPLDQRATYYQTVENTSSYGSALFIAQRADFSYQSIFSPNLQEILQQNQGNRTIAAQDIQGLIDTTKRSMTTYRPNEQGELAVARFESIKMVILNAPDAASLASMKAAAQSAMALAPTNPNGYILLGQEAIYEQKYADAYTAFEQARHLEPALPEAQFALVNLANLLHDQKRLTFYVLRAKQESPDFAAVVK